MSLREELIERLGSEARLELLPLWGNLPENIKKVLPVLADECIRQMAWTRWDSSISVDHGNFVHDTRQPLTLAPEDWRPS